MHGRKEDNVLARRDANGAMRMEEEWKRDYAQRAVALRRRETQLEIGERAAQQQQRREEARSRKAQHDADLHTARENEMQQKLLVSERRRVQRARVSTIDNARKHHELRCAHAAGAALPSRPRDGDTTAAGTTEHRITAVSYGRLVGRNHAAMMSVAKRVHADPTAFLKELVTESGADGEKFTLARPATSWR